jgi:hypothetical protein
MPQLGSIFNALRTGLRHEATLSFRGGKRTITACTAAWAKKMPDRPKPLPEEEFTEAFLKGTGPGGQKIVRLTLPCRERIERVAH